MGKGLRITLPLAMGLVSLPLMIWDIHNEQVRLSMGMGWDIGVPVWPYQTPDILLHLLNCPAYVVTNPISNALGLVVPWHYLLVFPATLAWWWFLGLRLDRGLVTARRWRWLVLSLLVVIASLSMWSAASSSVDAFRWWFEYADGAWNIHVLLMMTRFLTPAAWCAFLALLFAIAAKRVVSPVIQAS